MTPSAMEWDESDRDLAAFGELVRRELAVPQCDVERAAKRLMQRIATCESAEKRVRSRLLLLRGVIGILCGRSTTPLVLDAAARACAVPTLDDLREEQWCSFLHELRTILTAMCGQSIAALVWEAGKA